MGKIKLSVNLKRMEPSLKLLIIDDDEHVLAKLRYFLNEKMYDVTSAIDGLEGLKLLENDHHGYDLVLQISFCHE